MTVMTGSNVVVVVVVVAVVAVFYNVDIII